MYSIDWTFLLSRLPDTRRRRRDTPQTRSSRVPRVTDSLRAVGGVVWALGVTSMLTDISSEMVGSVLPLYLVLHLGMSPIAFGVLDGLYQGAAALVRVAAGIIADRTSSYKAIAVTGYALSAACRAYLPVAGNTWAAIAGVLAIDRIGKGIRTAPRDALISQATPQPLLATAFGVHRALDAAGAMFGPVVAFAVLAAVPRGFDVLFMISFAFAIVGVGAIVLLVPRPPLRNPSAPSESMLSVRGAASMLLAPGFRGLIGGSTVLAVATISDAFIYLLVQRRLGLAAMAFPLLYVGTSLFTALFAVPCGRLADRLGRKRVLLGGYALLALVYALLTPVMSLSTPALALVVVAVLGAYYAATDGVLTAMAAARLAPSRTGSGLAVLATTVNLARLASSVLFGAVWTWAGVTTATVGYLGLLAAAIAVASFTLPKEELEASAA